jgi:hypothetical protein
MCTTYLPLQYVLTACSALILRSQHIAFLYYGHAVVSLRRRPYRSNEAYLAAVLELASFEVNNQFYPVAKLICSVLLASSQRPVNTSALYNA